MAIKNPLNAFQSYSTHFILLACRTTENAKLFSDQGQAQETLLAIDNTSQLGQPVLYKQSIDDTFLVIDTRRFSQFSIESLNYEVLINGLQAGVATSNLATQIDMTILDSVGISFINFLQWLMDTKMQTNFDGMVFMLRTIFVGHNPDGSTQTVQTVTLPMHLFKMDVNLDYAKGIYTCVFMPNMNFAVNYHSRWLNIGSATTYFTGEGAKTLGAIVKSFENKLNEESSKFFEKASAVLLANRQPRTGTTNKFGRKVQYLITIPKDWEELTYAGGSVSASIEKVYPKKTQAATTTPTTTAASTDTATTPATAVNLSVDNGQTITQVLDIILSEVPEVKAFANAEKVAAQNGVIKFYKHVIGITSDPDTFLVQVHVVPFEIPNVVPPTSTQSALQGTQSFADAIYKQTDDGRRVPKEYFELDYIFTGKNIDVLNFDVKIQDVQWLLATNVKVSEGELVADLQASTPEQSKALAKKRTELLSSRQYDPIFIPLLTAEEKIAFTSMATARTEETTKKVTADKQAYARNLSAFYAISPIIAAVTIKGNPDIMAYFSTGTTMNHNAGVGGSGPPSREQFEADIINRGFRSNNNNTGSFTTQNPIGTGSYMTSPVFVKLNVKGPNVDFVTGAVTELINGQEFASSVLDDAYFVVFKVVNIIERGSFTQELELWSHNVFGTPKLTAEQVKRS